MGAGASAPQQVAPQALKLELEITSTVAVEAVVAIAEEAGRAVMAVYNSADASASSAKGDGSPLTRADQDANAVICHRLAELAPHVPIISEENKQAPYSVRKGYEYAWVVDPLDGTKEFLKRTGEFTVNIALVAGGRPVLGVVHAPAAGDTYFAVEGRGAYVTRGGGNGGGGDNGGGGGDSGGRITTQITAAAFDPAAPGLAVVGSASHASDATKEFVALFKDPKFTSMGSSLKLMLVAEGKAHVYPRLAPTMEWDTAAADVIVAEAGGAVVQAGKCSPAGEILEDWRDAVLREEPLQYNKPDLLNPCFVVFGRRQA